MIIGGRHSGVRITGNGFYIIDYPPLSILFRPMRENSQLVRLQTHYLKVGGVESSAVGFLQSKKTTLLGINSRSINKDLPSRNIKRTYHQVGLPIFRQ